MQEPHEHDDLWFMEDTTSSSEDTKPQDFYDALNRWLRGESMWDTQLDEKLLRIEVRKLLKAYETAFGYCSHLVDAHDHEAEKEAFTDVDHISFEAGFRQGRVEALLQSGQAIGHLLNLLTLAAGGNDA